MRAVGIPPLVTEVTRILPQIESGDPSAPPVELLIANQPQVALMLVIGCAIRRETTKHPSGIDFDYTYVAQTLDFELR